MTEDFDKKDHLIDDDYHEQFLRLLECSKKWCISASTMNHNALREAITDLNVFEPNSVI